jgi:head-tail adaptor
MRSQQVGSYRQRVTLYDIPEATRDSLGQPSQAATAICSFWAEVKPLQGGEQLNVRAIWPTATHKVKCRWLGSLIPASPSNPNGTILPRMYVSLELDGSRLDVVFASNVEKRNRMWELTCEEKVST